MNEIQSIEHILREVSTYIAQMYFSRDTLKVQTKANSTDFLTEVDINVQKKIVDFLTDRYPTDVIIAEESGLDSIGNTIPSRSWMVDPIDGTQNFLRGLFPEFGVSIGFLKDGQSIAGGVIFPITGDIFLSEKGSGSYKNGVKISVTSIDEPKNARVDIDFGALEDRQQFLGKSQRLLQSVGQVRSYGCSVMGFCQVAEGQQDAYIPFSVKPWDVAAGILLVQEAGGTVTSFENEPVSAFNAEKIGIVSNTKLHSACLRILNS